MTAFRGFPRELFIFFDGLETRVDVDVRCNGIGPDAEVEVDTDD